MPPARPPEWRLENRAGQLDLCLTGDWIAQQGGTDQIAAITTIARQAAGRTLYLNTQALGNWDSALIIFLDRLQTAAAIDQTSLPDAARRLLRLASLDQAAPAAPPAPRARLTERVGLACFRAAANALAFTGLVGETAIAGTSLIARRSQMRGHDIVPLMHEAGAGALSIVAIVNGLVGAILAFVGAVQLRRFGAGIYVANLVGIAVIREMAAIVTAIVMAGRTGGAYAAHLATMQGNEEIDALNALGIPVFDFLILPRLIALVTMMPLLYFYGCACGLGGGLLVGIATLELTPIGFIEQLHGAVSLAQFMIGFAKSLVFGALVALAGCHIGLRAGRSAADVGAAATSAVVAGIVGVIALDAIFAVCANTLGI